MNSSNEIGFITGDGIGIDIMPVVIEIVNSAIDKSYDSSKKILWREIIVGQKAVEIGNEPLNDLVLQKIRDLKICLKGPLDISNEFGFRSLTVEIRQKLDLYASVRPVRYFSGVPTRMRNPEKLDVIIFRENTEDVYQGIEFRANTAQAEQLCSFLSVVYGEQIREGSGIGIKLASRFGSERIMRAAINYAINNQKRSVCIVHKGNIMKCTEGAFRDWCYNLAKSEFKDKIVFESEIEKGIDPKERLIIKDRMTDLMFQELILKPEEFDVICCMNLNGDYLSDAASAQVGGPSLAHSANINYESKIAVFEPTHGPIHKYAGQNKVNPTSLLLSAVMMLEYLGLQEAADLIVYALEKTFLQRKVTFDFARQMSGRELMSCSGFGKAVISNMRK